MSTAGIPWLRAGNNAVITGGANGIGLAAAKALRERGMRVLIADQDEKALQAALDAVEGIEGAVCDVSDFAQVSELAETALGKFGQIHCLMNNAGAGMPPAAPWEHLERWKKQLDINLWGIIHGCQAFVPAMLEAGEAASVINTGSKQGLTNPPGGYAYNLSKAGVLSYTQSLAHALRQVENCRVSAHLLVPGFTYSNMIARFLPEKPAGAWMPDQVVAFMLESLQRGDFCILCPDNDTPRELDEKRIQWHTDDLLQNRPALSRWHPDHEEAFADFVKD